VNTYEVVGGGVLRGNNYMIEAREVRKSFGRTLALRGATVAAAPGEILAIMGPSGSGKSTLLHCLAGIFPPDEGEVWFDGTRLDVRSEAVRTRLRRTAFGFVFQFGQLVPELTAADNVALPLLSLVVLLEAAVPLATATVVAAAIAYGTSMLAFVKLAPADTPVPQLGLAYFLLIGVGLAVAFVVIAATLPLLRPMTAPASVRFE
jgi:ABC-type sugar transport system ATPase subunit